MKNQYSSGNNCIAERIFLQGVSLFEEYFQNYKEERVSDKSYLLDAKSVPHALQNRMSVTLSSGTELGGVEKMLIENKPLI